jgi:PIN domain nuclease of toxin-antitoxin system
VNLLLDTHLLLWVAAGEGCIPQAARALIEDASNTLHFSVASLWEITIKRGLGRDDFRVDPVRLRRGLLENAYAELTITAGHALGVDTLSPLHKDPFDRLLLSQARIEGLTLLTTDQVLAQYSEPVHCIS